MPACGNSSASRLRSLSAIKSSRTHTQIRIPRTRGIDHAITHFGFVPILTHKPGHTGPGNLLEMTT